MLRISKFFCVVVLLLFAANAKADIIYVDPSGMSGSNPAYTTIQAAVNAATLGTTIDVDAATYNENVTINTQGITLAGSQFGVNPVLGRSGLESILNGTINTAASGVTVDGFTIDANSQWAIMTSAANSIIQNNIVANTGYGIQINVQGSLGPNAAEITLNAIVQNNAVQSNVAIVLWNTASNTVQGNSVNGGGAEGIDIYYSNDNNVVNNEVNSTSLAAIRLRGAYGNVVEYNYGGGNAQPNILYGEGSSASNNTVLNNFGPGDQEPPPPPPTPTPEPSSFMLALAGGVSVFSWYRLRRKGRQDLNRGVSHRRE